MRITLDTNILISTIVFKGSIFNKLFEKLYKNHEIILSSYVLEESNDIINRKFPNHKLAFYNFISNLQYTYYKYNKSSVALAIRDKKDIPIYISAIKSKTDIIVTGDKDLLEYKNTNHKIIILTTREFLDKY